MFVHVYYCKVTGANWYGATNNSISGYHFFIVTQIHVRMDLTQDMSNSVENILSELDSQLQILV